MHILHHSILYDTKNIFYYLFKSETLFYMTIELQTENIFYINAGALGCISPKDQVKI